jgi:predicted DNA-binding transcriptional regulator YafY
MQGRIEGVAMVFSDSLTKAGRLMELQLIFARQPQRSHSTRELARRLGTAVRTVRNYLTELSVSGRLPIVQERKRWQLAPGARIEMPPVRFELEEAAAVYLAARLLCRHSDEPNPAVRASIGKLAVVVPEDLGAVMNELAARADRGREGEFGGIFRAFAYGWALHRELEVTYHSINRRAPRTCRFRTYLLEPSVHGYSMYALGHADPPGELRVFKLERVIRARDTGIPFEPMPPGELLGRLEQSWDVWISGGEAVVVRLRFAPKVARAVREARWHASQVLEALPGGGVEMRLAVASTLELVPWVLGWGEACEVLAPAELRDHVARHLRDGAALYGAAPGPSHDPRLVL